MKLQEKKLEEKKERGFREVMKKLFWIVPLRKKEYTKYFLKTMLLGINGVTHVLFLAKITEVLEDKDAELFSSVLLMYAAYIFTFEIANFLMKKWGWMTTIPMGQQDILNEYIPKYITLDNNSVEKAGTGKMYNLFDKGMLEWTEIVAEFFESGSRLLVSVIFTLYMIGKVDIIYSGIFVILLVVFIVAGNYSNSKLWEFRKERFTLRSNIAKNLVKVMMSKIEILSAGKVLHELQTISGFSERLRDVNIEMSFHRVMLKRVSQFIMSLLLLLSFWYVGNQYLAGEVTLSILVGLTGTLIIMQKSIEDIIGLYVKLTKRYVSVDRFWNFFDITPEIEGYEEGKDFVYGGGNISIKNMSFGYGDTADVFTNFNMNIAGGKVSAFVGNSGSGKTTLVKIISGYLKHNSGSVEIDGQKNTEVALKSLYKHIGYLTQDPSVFDGTIRENLMYGMNTGQTQGTAPTDNSRAESCAHPDLDEIIKLAKCKFIYDLPDGLDTEIGEKGVRLSGGQKQRLAIAKIFLKNPEIIILDEPTSALDSFSEEQITKAMHNLFENRTVIIIAHRLQTVKNADTIFVLENGKVVEEGNHETLVLEEGVYKKMLDLQSGF